MTINYEQIGKNTDELVKATEWFTTLMHFLYNERGVTQQTLKIGTFTYDNDWTANLYCVLEEHPHITYVYFKEVRCEQGNVEDVILERIKRLTDLCYGWGFQDSTVDINWNLINDFRALLNENDNERFSICYDRIHSDLW